MPRGWLKHQDRAVGKRASRGGSSSRYSKQKEGNQENRPKPRRNRCRLQNINVGKNEEELSWRRNGDIYMRDSHEELSSSDKYISSFSKNKDAVAKECQICYEIRPLVSLSNKCNHEPVCHGCLREMYVNQAQRDVSNYPLRCFHPSCRKVVNSGQLIKNNLFYSKKELTKHYRLEILRQAYSSSKDIVHCPQCEFPRIVNLQNIVSCRQCKIVYRVGDDTHSNMFTTIASIESIESDKMGSNDGWAHCPRCKMIISKGAGCGHMTCFCGEEFSWIKALDEKKPPLKYAKKGKIGTLSM